MQSKFVRHLAALKQLVYVYTCSYRCLLSLLAWLPCLRLIRDDVRVSEELGERGPGTERSLCGYQIRFEAKMETVAEVKTHDAL